MAKLFRRYGRYYAWVPKEGGGFRKVATGCVDKDAARVVAAGLERRAVDPAHAAAAEATVDALVTAYRVSRKRLGRSEGTLHHTRVKGGHLVRLLPARAAAVTHAIVESYIDARLAEGAKRTTVKKELRVLKAALRLGAKNALFAADPDNVIPELEDDYVPRTRFLTPWEFVGLVRELGEDERAATVAFVVATGARWGEASRAQAQDVTERNGVVFVRLRGTKTVRSAREVPVLGAGVPMLTWALAHVGVEHEAGRERSAREGLFPRWVSRNRDLRAACARAGIAPVSPNDLRRTFATWLQQAGAGNDLLSQTLGHVDGRMVERVYGRMSPDDVARLIAARTSEGAAKEPGPGRGTGPSTLSPGGGSEEPGTDTAEWSQPSDATGLASRAPLPVGVSAETGAFVGPLKGRGGAVPEPIEANQRNAPLQLPADSVPRDGIEPPTRGFSILRSAANPSSNSANWLRMRAAGVAKGSRLSDSVAAYEASEWLPLGVAS